MNSEILEPPPTDQFSPTMSTPISFVARAIAAPRASFRAIAHARAAARPCICSSFYDLTQPSLFPSTLAINSSRHRREFHAACALPAGHSHWANIKVGKAAKDNERASNFTKLGNLIRAAIRTGGADPQTNHLLARLINEAKSIDMPKDTLTRILSPRAAGDVKPFFEIKGPASSLIVLQVLTSNQRRTEIELRTILKKYAGQLLSNAGLLSYFQHKGIIIASKHDTTEETALDDGIRIGAEEVTLEDAEASGEKKLVAQFRFQTDPMELVNVKRGLEEAGYSIIYAEAEYLPLQTMELTGKDAETFKVLCEKLEEHPDVAQIFTNVA